MLKLIIHNRSVERPHLIHLPAVHLDPRSDPLSTRALLSRKDGLSYLCLAFGAVYFELVLGDVQPLGRFDEVGSALGLVVNVLLEDGCAAPSTAIYSILHYYYRTLLFYTSAEHKIPTDRRGLSL